MSNLGEPIQLPSISLPNTVNLPRPTLSIPTADIPSYKPLVVPPSDLERPKGTAEEESAEKEPAPPPPVPTIPKIDIPVVNIEVPLPTTEVVAAATYAAVTAVAATTLAQPFFEQIKKKLQKFIQGKIDKWKEKRKKKKDSSES